VASSCFLFTQLLGCCAGPVDFVQSYGMRYESKNPLSAVTLGIFLRKTQWSQWQTRWKISPRHLGYGKAVHTKANGPQVCRQTTSGYWKGCTWAQILAKTLPLNILEECFCLFHWNEKYYFSHLNSPVSFKPCLIETFCIHNWIQDKKYC